MCETFWAKTIGQYSTYPLWRHSLDTAGAVQALWDGWLRPGLREYISERIAEGDEALASRLVGAIAGLHDIGKAVPGWQYRAASTDGVKEVLERLKAEGLGETSEKKPRHETISQYLVSERMDGRAERSSTFPGTGEGPDDSYVGNNWAAAVVGGHHGKFLTGRTDEQDALVHDIEHATRGSVWASRRNALIDTVLNAHRVSWADLTREPASDPGTVIVLVSGLVMVADWLASADYDIAPTMMRGAEYTQWAKARYAASLPETVGTPVSPRSELEAVFGTAMPTLRPLQQTGHGYTDRGLWLATETTGAGKTEAALLRHVATEENLVFVLPTRATTNRMWERIFAVYRGVPQVAALAHGYSSLHHFYTSDASEDGLHPSEWASDVMGNIKPLLLPIVVGTIDRVLMGSLRRRHGAVRLLALANAHVVIDECHLLDPYQAELLVPLLEWWGKTDTRVTMLSASMPRQLSKKFLDAYAGRACVVDPPYPGSVSLVNRKPVPHRLAASAREYELEIKSRYVLRADWPVSRAIGMSEAAVEEVASYMAQHPDSRVAVILNTVDAAIETARALRLRGFPVVMLHSRMAAAHREAVTQRLEDEIAGKSVGRNGDGHVVVGTQVLEASLDLDFDYLVSELAPADALIQRAGRTWRFSKPSSEGWEHQRTTRSGNPVLCVLMPLDPDGKVARSFEYPYLRAPLVRTFEALPKSLPIPGAVQGLVDASYAPVNENSVDNDDILSSNREIVSAVRRVTSANQSRIEVGELFGRDVSYRTLARLTEETADDELDSTRFVDYDQKTVILVGEASRWCYPTMASVPNGRLSPSQIQEVLGRTISVAVSKIAETGPLREKTGCGFPKGLLRNVVIVEMANGTTYDNELGLIYGDEVVV